MADGFDDVVKRVADQRGQVVTLGLSGDEASELITRLDFAYDHDDGYTSDVEIRLVLGAACTTAAEAVEQFVAALQLPYAAANGWDEFIVGLGDRRVSLRQCVVVADAGELLRKEKRELWVDLVESLRGGPYYLGGGWTTLVLAYSGAVPDSADRISFHRSMADK